MKLAWVCVVLACLGGVARGDSIDDAEAKRRGITTQQIQVEKQLQQAQQKIAELEKELAQAKKEIMRQGKMQGDSTTEAGKPFWFAHEIEAMPDNIRAKVGEPQQTAEARIVWLKDHFQNRHLRVSFIATKRVSEKKKILVIESAPDDVLDFHAECEFPQQNHDAMAIKEKESVVIEGDIIGVDISGGIFGNERPTVTLGNCSIISAGKK